MLTDTFTLAYQLTVGDYHHIEAIPIQEVPVHQEQLSKEVWLILDRFPYAHSQYMLVGKDQDVFCDKFIIEKLNDHFETTSPAISPRSACAI